MMTILSCDIDRVLRGSRNRVMKMGSGAKFSSSSLRAIALGIRPSNPFCSLVSASQVACLLKVYVDYRKS